MEANIKTVIRQYDDKEDKHFEFANGLEQERIGKLEKDTPFLTRYEKDVLKYANENCIFVNIPFYEEVSDHVLKSIGRLVLDMLKNENRLMLANTSNTSLEKLAQKELILRISKG